jgi:hypothetical protein
MKSAFLKSGHLLTLVGCFLYFDLSVAWGGIAAVRLRWREDAAMPVGVRV